MAKEAEVDPLALDARQAQRHLASQRAVPPTEAGVELRTQRGDHVVEEEPRRRPDLGVVLLALVRPHLRKKSVARQRKREGMGKKE